ncbi:hypothetical protein ABPG72_022332 [Tetrahymena utriculariae]
MAEDEKIKSQNNLKESLLSKTDTGEAKAKQYVPKKIFGADGNLIALSVMNFFLNAAVSVITPFYPGIANDKNVNQTLIGLIFALNPIGSFSVSLSIGQMMGFLGKKNLMFYGLIIQVLTIVTFGVVYYIDNEGAFIAVSMIARFFQGASRSCYGAATFGYVPQLWPDSIQKKIGIMETMTAIGLLLGPMIGQALNNLAGSNAALAYQLPFYVLSGIFTLCIFTIKWLPPDVKNKVEIDKVKAIDCMKIGPIFWTFSLMTASAVANTYINPQYTRHMTSLGLDEGKAGYVISVGAFFYMVFLHLMPHISKRLDKKFIITLGTFISILGILVQSPETYLGFPLGGDHWYLVTIGQSINGIASAMVILPMIPELIELIVVNEMKIRKVAQPDLKMIRACSDMGSSIFVGGYALGTFIGPFGGSLLYDFFGGGGSSDHDDAVAFRDESRIFVALVTLIMILYIIFGKGYLGLISTAKKLKICQKKKVQNNEKAIIKRQTLLAERQSKYTANKINTSDNNGINNTTSMNQQQQISESEIKGDSQVGESQEDKFKLSEHSDDELLSDNSLCDVLSAGSGGAGEDTESHNIPAPIIDSTGKENENNTYYFE